MKNVEYFCRNVTNSSYFQIFATLLTDYCNVILVFCKRSHNSEFELFKPREDFSGCFMDKTWKRSTESDDVEHNTCRNGGTSSTKYRQSKEKSPGKRVILM